MAKASNPARQAALRALVAVEKGSARLLLDQRRLTPRDRDLALELARGVERRRIFLDFVLQQCVDRGLPGDPMLLSALRLGAYQLLVLERIPAYAAIHASVALLPRGGGFANAVLRRIQRQIVARAADPARPRQEIALGPDRALVLDGPALPDPAEHPSDHVALVRALPAFLVARWARAYGDSTAARIAGFCDRVPAVFLRVNSMRGSASELAARLAEAGVQTEPAEHPRILRWTGGDSPFACQAFAAGCFVAQDPTALAAVDAVQAQPGETIVDLCAGPGTKATALAEAVGPHGRVHAYDVDERRRRPIRQNARRLGLEEVLRVHDDPATLPVADRVLVDVPCSNTGVLARRVEVRRRVTPDGIAELARLQAGLLRAGLERVRPGGRLVYSTCSLEPDENAAVVATLADAVTVTRDCLTLPGPACDGGYFAILEPLPGA